MERRRHTRFKVDIGALVSLDGRPPSLFRIQDISEGGVRLVVPAGLPGVDPRSVAREGDPLSLRFATELGTLKKEFLLQAHIARIFDGGVAATLDGIDPEILKLLGQSAAGRAGGTLRASANSGGNPQPEDSNYKEVFPALRTRAEGDLVAAFSRFLQRIGERLVADAALAESGDRERLMLDLVTEFKVKQGTLKARFRRQLAESLDGLEKGAPRRFSLDPAWAPLKAVVTQAEAQNRAELSLLNQRLTRVAGIEIGPASNPVSPTATGVYFETGLAQLVIPWTLREVVYTSFGRRFLDELGPFYHELNRLLIQAGVAPELKPEPPRPAVEAGGAFEPPNPREAPPREPAPPAAPAPIAPPPAVPAPPAVPPGEPVPAAVLQRILASPAVAPGAEAPPLSQRIFAQLEKTRGANGRPQVLAPAQREALLLVERLMGRLLDAPGLPAEVARWLRRMELPLLWTILENPALALDHAHPICKIIDGLEALVPLVEERARPESREIAARIEQRLAPFGTGLADPARLADFARELTELSRPRIESAQRTTARVVQSCEGQQRVLEGRELVESELLFRMLDRRLPIQAARFLEELWRHVLLQTWLRLGPASVEWRDRLWLVDRLVDGAAFRPGFNPAPAERTLPDRAATAVAAMLPGEHRSEALLAGLRAIYGVPVPEAQWVDLPTESLADFGSAAPPDLAQTLRERPESIPPARWREAVEQAIGLTVDEWVAMGREAQTAQPRRLAWVGKEHRRFLFVDRRGVKQADLTLPQVAGQLADGMIRLGDNYELPALERSALGIVAQLHSELTGRAAPDLLAAPADGGPILPAVGEGASAQGLPESETIALLEALMGAYEAGRLGLTAQKIAPLNGRGKSLFEIVPHLPGAQRPMEDYIQAAEGASRMVEIDHWLMQTLFFWMSQLGAKLDAVGGCAVHISGGALDAPDFAEYIQMELERNGGMAEKLWFVLAEPAVLARPGEAVRFIRTVRRCGARVALADFGRGGGPSAPLRRLPVDGFKIAGDWIRDLPASPQRQAAVQAFRSIAHFLGKETIAEGVDSPELLTLVRRLGIDYVQGSQVAAPYLLKT